MSDLKELYQQVILDHSKQPRNFHENAAATRKAEGFNPLCGDRITIYLTIDDDTITDVSFTGSACAICTSSSSMMTQFLKDKSLKQAERAFERFRNLVMGKVELLDVIEELDKLAAFSGVCEFPIRVKCATLPWHTMMAAMGSRQGVVSTE